MKYKEIEKLETREIDKIYHEYEHTDDNKRRKELLDKLEDFYCSKVSYHFKILAEYKTKLKNLEDKVNSDRFYYHCGNWKKDSEYFKRVIEYQQRKHDETKYEMDTRI